MTITFSHKSRARTLPHKKYSIGGVGRLYAYADTLEEAKRAGKTIADREYLRGKWNVAFITVPILEADAPGSSRYNHTGWRMYVPVRGSGVRYKDIVKRIRDRHRVSPMVWTKN